MKVSQRRVGGALHSGLLALAGLDAGNGLHSFRAWRDATPVSAYSMGCVRERPMDRVACGGGAA